MTENLTSSDTLHDEQLPLSAGSELKRGKTSAFGDTLTLQAILCVLLAIGFVVTNIMNGSMAADIFELYKNKLRSDGNAAEILKNIVNYIGSLF